MLTLRILPVATIVLVILAIIGGVDVIVGHYNFHQYVKDISVAFGLLAIGRGIDSSHKP